MLKINIVGSPGAGKSIFAQKLKDIIKLPLYHLDIIWHKSDKTNISKEEFDMRLNEILKRNSWIIDGNYQRTLEIRLKECDTIFLLDYPLKICLSGAQSRIGKKREDLPWIEPVFDENFKQFIIDFPQKQLPHIYKLLEKYSENRNVIIFKSRKEADDYLKQMKQ